MNKLYVKIDGIHCSHCIKTITDELLKNKNIKQVKIKRNIAHISYENKLTHKEIIKTINNINEITKEEYISDKLSNLDTKIQLKEFIIIILSIVIIYFLLNYIFGYNIFNVIPNIDSNITYSMLFVTGLLTSIHCISMCGAINLMAVVDNNKKDFKRPLLYNLGRVIYYTILGGIVGALGSVLSINTTIKGIIILLASILMILMSLNMLQVIDFKLPIIHRFKNKSNNSLVIGLLNGLMPCGPLQAMQVYALSTGSFINGALSMFLFSLGTVPLMLFVGVFYNLFKADKRIIINKVASTLILILSIVMLNRGLLTLNVDLTKVFKNYDNFTKSTLVDDYQVIEFNLDYNNYEDIILQKGIKTKLIIHADEKHLNGCNSEINFKDFNINKKLEVGDNIIEFTPDKTGTFNYTCWMEMINNNIKVIDDKSYFKGGN